MLPTLSTFPPFISSCFSDGLGEFLPQGAQFFSQSAQKRVFDSRFEIPRCARNDKEDSTHNAVWVATSAGDADAAVNKKLYFCTY